MKILNKVFLKIIYSKWVFRSKRIFDNLIKTYNWKKPFSCRLYKTGFSWPSTLDFMLVYKHNLISTAIMVISMAVIQMLSALFSIKSSFGFSRDFTIRYRPFWWGSPQLARQFGGPGSTFQVLCSLGLCKAIIIKYRRKVSKYILVEPQATRNEVLLSRLLGNIRQALEHC
jgi:hypothetical protein